MDVKWSRQILELLGRGGMADVGPGGRRTLAERIDHLFQTVHPADGEYTHEEVANGIREAGGPTISASYLWQLRKGVRDNPTMRHLEALSKFFGVPPAYFFDDEVSERIDVELSLLASLRDASVRQVALRASGLSVESIEAIVEMIERVRKLEGLPGPNGDHEDKDGTSRGG
jgi:transcriptional regulator with XRE-family HTH domain